MTYSQYAPYRKLYEDGTVIVTTQPVVYKNTELPIGTLLVVECQAGDACHSYRHITESKTSYVLVNDPSLEKYIFAYGYIGKVVKKLRLHKFYALLGAGKCEK